jgi:hypothetical protein
MNPDFCNTEINEQSSLNRPHKDKFILVLNLPWIMRERSFEKKFDITPLQMSVYGAIVPTIQIPPTEMRFSGQALHISSYSRPAYAPLTVNFVVDNNFHNYWLLWSWLEILNSPNYSLYDGTPNKQLNPPRNLETGTLTEYQANISVFALNEYNQKIIEFVYKNAVITGLGGINYDYRDAEAIESSVDFHFGQFEIKPLPPPLTHF